MIATRSERIAIPDGELGAHVALPAAGAGRGLVLLHEIFGVNVYVRDVAERLGELGTSCSRPTCTGARSRASRSTSTTRRACGRGSPPSQQLDFAAAVGDAIAALALLRAMPEVPDERARRCSTTRRRPRRRGG